MIGYSASIGVTRTILRDADMRHVRNPQGQLGEMCIEDIKIDTKSRDDIPALLLGLQYLYSNETFWRICSRSAASLAAYPGTRPIG